MKQVVYSCPFIPPEWIAAHGIQPKRIRPAPRTGNAISAGLCSYAHSFLQTALELKPNAVILSTRCEQMRRIIESQADDKAATPFFIFNVPATWQTANARELYSSELRRLGAFLAKLGGRAPSKKRLAEEISAWDYRRNKLREIKNTPSHLLKLLEYFHEHGGKLPNQPAQPQKNKTGIPLAVIGGPLLAGENNILSAIEQAGGNIVFEGTEDGERTLPGAVFSEKLPKAPFEEIVRIYFDTIPDVFRRPDAALHEWLKRMIEIHKPRGLVISHFVWCDLWRAQTSRIREWSGLPTLSLDLSADSGEGASQNLRTRLSAFIEELT